MLPFRIQVRMDFLSFSHLRWNFVFQRPQHILSRCAREHRVFFWEEPVYTDSPRPGLKISRCEHDVVVVVPELPTGTSEQQSFESQRSMLLQLLSEQAIEDPVLWYYNPMAISFTNNLKPIATVYDCMDELSAFRGAPPGLRAAESELFRASDLVFTGGQSLYESKRNHHPSVHLFPSSIDFKHFALAREPQDDPADQAQLPHPRLGYCGVIDERMDTDLLARIADLRPEWRIVMVGPVVKISDADLPRRPNIEYLGSKSYKELPAYVAGWDVALLPFALNESTRFISPTKTPEYLAAGKPVISTPIADVIRPYGELGLVSIAATVEEFVAAAEHALHPEIEQVRAHQRKIDAFLARNSWDSTWSRMRKLVLDVAAERRAPVVSSYDAGAKTNLISAD
ncbi:MAG TPA: glycosyltransferase family 1 protein [Terriglobales bacterium]|nr:glycosyltransferase family 1 protein [Terriglobales bacterium]